ncbi:MAG TPA: glycosyltransferase [Firmicutes bacterium]|nr:glycosyltransferase [Bacillota bacterium]
MRNLSVVVPCYNEQEAIPLFYQEITLVLKKMNCDYQILFVNDGSKDQSLQAMEALAGKAPNVKYLSFSRNFGKEAAMLAGMQHATGDLVVIMDVDLQDPPALLPEMIKAIENEGYDSVATRRVSRTGEPPLRSLFARIFYKIINKLSDAEIVDGARDYRMMTRQMMQSILELNEYHRFSKGIFGWVGYETKWLAYENIKRVVGETKWSFWKLLKYALEGIIAFTTIPLRIASFFGIAFSGFAFLLLVLIVVRRLIFGDAVAGWASTMCVIILVSGLQMIFLGIMGEYLARTYMETKARPKYFIKKKNI